MERRHQKKNVTTKQSCVSIATRGAFGSPRIKRILTSPTAQVGRYAGGADVGEGARWSPDRARAWRLGGGTVEREVSLAEAAEIAARLGLAVPDSIYELSPDACARQRARVAEIDANDEVHAARAGM